jgi:hypothetical protein
MLFLLFDLFSALRATWWAFQAKQCGVSFLMALLHCFARTAESVMLLGKQMSFFGFFRSGDFRQPAERPH